LSHCRWHRGILVEPLVGLKFLLKKKKKYVLSPTAKIYLLPESLFYWGAILTSVRTRNEYQKILAAINNGVSPLTIACFDLLMFINHQSQ